MAAGTLGAAGALGGALAAMALLRTRDALAAGNAVPTLLPRAELATAYAGGALGIAAVTALAYAAILLGHQYASYDPDQGRSSAEPSTG